MENDLTGHRFGLLQVLSRDRDVRPVRFVVRCDCGTEKSVRADHLRGGKTISCGCEHKRRTSARAGVMHAANVKHGASGTGAYVAWLAMKQRCLNPKNKHFARYGGRGITICERWTDFANFLADMGQPEAGKTLERRNNDSQYSPNNCRWATREDQSNNRSVNRRHTFDGRTMTIAQWSREFGIHRNTLDQRLASGVPFEEAIRPTRRTNMEQIYGASRASSIARKARTHCTSGHPFDGTYGKGRYCKTCHAMRRKERLSLSGTV